MEPRIKIPCQRKVGAPYKIEFTQDMPEICPLFATGLPEICLKCLQNMPIINQECVEFVLGTPEAELLYLIKLASVKNMLP